MSDLERLREALMFYARKEHWMPLAPAGDNDPDTLLIAGAGDCKRMDGWAKARKVLFNEDV